MPSLKKSLIVEQFQGNYLKVPPRGKDYRALDLRTSRTTSTRFNLKFFLRILEKYSTQKASFYYQFHLKN